MLAYDATRKRTVLAAGYGINSKVKADVWEFFPATATHSTFGTGCASTAEPPSLKYVTLPRIGQEFQLEIANMLPNKFGMLVVGASDKTWRGNSLPLNTGFMGMPNCSLLVSWDFAFLIWSSTGKIVWKINVPKDVHMIGSLFYTQAWVLDPKANAAQIATSNGGAGKVGI